jgi:predicted nucleic acid-binding protein
LRIYVDTSALAKRYVQEPGSEQLQKLFVAEVAEVVVSTLVLPEFGAALARKVRNREIGAKSAASAMAEFEVDWQEIFVKIPLTEEIAESAAKLILAHPLRGADAVHLASAIAFEAELFVASDGQLLKASKKHGIKTYDPSAGK